MQRLLVLLTITATCLFIFTEGARQIGTQDLNADEFFSTYYTAPFELSYGIYSQGGKVDIVRSILINSCSNDAWQYLFKESEFQLWSADSTLRNYIQDASKTGTNYAELRKYQNDERGDYYLVVYNPNKTPVSITYDVDFNLSKKASLVAWSVFLTSIGTIITSISFIV